ncbi:hypothetical protein [Brevundimonas sp. TWP2-3-4b2]|uniref:hypothetical protein n=1 Tax=Brevundimonas sp. TWP2-3-4b2 TaxID=2804595 RepID=UPI003CEEF80F
MTLWLGNGEHPDIRDHKEKWHSHATAFFPIERAWRRAPSNLEFLVAVNWSFSPGSERRDGLFIQKRRSKAWPWALWAYEYDDNWGVWSWALRATSDEAYCDAATAGRALLEASWKWEREQWNTRQFDEVDTEGLVSQEDAWALATECLGGD